MPSGHRHRQVTARLVVEGEPPTTFLLPPTTRMGVVRARARGHGRPLSASDTVGQHVPRGGPGTALEVYAARRDDGPPVAQEEVGPDGEAARVGCVEHAWHMMWDWREARGRRYLLPREACLSAAMRFGARCFGDHVLFCRILVAALLPLSRHRRAWQWDASGGRVTLGESATLRRAPSDHTHREPPASAYAVVSGAAGMGCTVGFWARMQGLASGEEPKEALQSGEEDGRGHGRGECLFVAGGSAINGRERNGAPL